MNETFGQRFQRLRKSAGLTQEDVATKLNITSQAVSKWENDISAPDISVLLELSETLNVSVEQILGKEPIADVVLSESKKDAKSMVFRIRIISSDGDKVNVNIPLALSEVFLNSDSQLLNIKAYDKNVLSGIDFKQLISLVEQGVVGKIVDVESTDGDIIEIWVE